MSFQFQPPASIGLIRFSFISGISLLGTPTEVYIYGIQYLYIMGGIITMGFVMMYIYLPVFHDLKLTSTYQVRSEPDAAHSLLILHCAFYSTFNRGSTKRCVCLAAFSSSSRKYEKLIPWYRLFLCSQGKETDEMFFSSTFWVNFVVTLVVRKLHNERLQCNRPETMAERSKCESCQLGIEVVSRGRLFEKFEVSKCNLLNSHKSIPLALQSSGPQLNPINPRIDLENCRL